jgi:hypothetical protein
VSGYYTRKPGGNDGITASGVIALVEGVYETILRLLGDGPDTGNKHKQLRIKKICIKSRAADCLFANKRGNSIRAQLLVLN